MSFWISSKVGLPVNGPYSSWESADDINKQLYTRMEHKIETTRSRRELALRRIVQQENAEHTGVCTPRHLCDRCERIYSE